LKIKWRRLFRGVIIRAARSQIGVKRALQFAEGARHDHDEGRTYRKNSIGNLG